MIEEWKDVVGFEELFQVSSFGRLHSKLSGKLRKLHLAKSGYVQVCSKLGGRDGKYITFRLHQEVAKAFLEEPSKEIIDWAKDTHYGVAIVNHIDGNKKNNHHLNLEWCTSKTNSEHYHSSDEAKIINQIKNKHLAKLEDSQVRDIRQSSKLGVSQRKLAAKYGISRSAINNAVSGYKWVE